MRVAIYVGAGEPEDTVRQDIATDACRAWARNEGHTVVMEMMSIGTLDTVTDDRRDLVKAVVGGAADLLVTFDRSTWNTSYVGCDRHDESLLHHAGKRLLLVAEL